MPKIVGLPAACKALLAALVVNIGLAWGHPASAADFSAAEAMALSNSALKSLPSGSAVLAVCGPSAGREYHPNPAPGDSKAPSWENGSIPKGRMVFVAIGDRFDLLFLDAVSEGKYTSIGEQDGTLLKTYDDKSSDSATFVALYPGHANSETYVLLRKPSGKLSLIWTVARGVTGEMSPLAKVGAYVADCFSF